MTKRWRYVAVAVAAAVLAVVAILTIEGGVWPENYTQFESEEPERQSRNVNDQAQSPLISRESLLQPAPSVPSDSQLPPLYFAELKQKAARGDPEAQRELSYIYGECMWYSISPSTYLAHMDQMASMSSESTAYMQALKARRTALCSTVDDGAPIPLEAYTLWLDQAARSGDVAAQIRKEARSLEVLSQDRYVELADAALASKDPQALLDLGDLLALAPQDIKLGPYTEVSGTSYAGYAWGIAACRRGMFCGRGSRVMDGLCLSTGRCNQPDYESFVYFNLAPAGDRKPIEKLVGKINRLLDDDNFTRGK